MKFHLMTMAVEDFFFYLVFGLCKEVCFQTEGERECVYCVLISILISR